MLICFLFDIYVKLPLRGIFDRLNAPLIALMDSISLTSRLAGLQILRYLGSGLQIPNRHSAGFVIPWFR
ncbi:hypothetical protein SAMN04488057_1245 [Cyclobacterium lianum]|uniref:Uncharacterized protein n=1 Tax=Cyclobacterium lianum TaxID=388280 RepID=A0A1M7QTE5_9BACT|nr:hypothetical protein SAMN04488057_1245 [Cyclobacterium lianum]